MIDHLHVKGFKSWADTGDIRLGRLTGLFGTNSSGKTSLLQFLLMLKQTVETPDRSRVLHTGDRETYVDLGTFYDIVHGHAEPGEIAFSLSWKPPEPLAVPSPENPSQQLFHTDRLTFEAVVEGKGTSISVERFAYTFEGYHFGMRRKKRKDGHTVRDYDLISEGYAARRTLGRKWPLPPPVKTYGFPDQATAYFQNTGFLPDFVLAFEQQFSRMYYLGPLREYPNRTYLWAGERPSDVGRRGERAVAALLASREEGRVISMGAGRGKRRRTVEEHVAAWLQDLGLIHSFSLRPIAPNRKDYEVRVRRTAASPEVLITDVGFGVSQILPVLTLCFYAPEGSTLVLEQPEIHLHPAVQAGLADVFIDAIKRRNVQIILESHSEHLLRRLQRRIAEEHIDAGDVALYFANLHEGGSRLNPLRLDPYGNMLNWPDGFFGDEMGDLAAMTDAAMRRMEAGA